MASTIDNTTDKEKIEKILNSIQNVSYLTSSNHDQSNNLRKPLSAIKITPDAANLVSLYASELACAILEESAQLAKHANRNKINDRDINLILAKKFSIDSHQKGQSKVTTHLQMLKSAPTPNQIEVPVNLPPNDESNVEAENRPSKKRSLGATK